MSWWKRASWSRRQEKPKKLELVVEKQLPCESWKHQRLEKPMLKVQDAPRHQSQGRLGRVKVGVHLGGPREILGIPMQSIRERTED